MTRLLTFLVHNWPLKLAAVCLAALLYSVLVLTQNTQARTDLRIPIRATNQPPDVILLSNLGEVTEVRFLVPADAGIRVDSSSFEATVDLSRVDPNAGTSVVPVQVRAIDDRIRILGFAPARLNVLVERLTTREGVPVVVKRLDDPAGLDIRDPEVTPAAVTIRGAASAVRRVDRVQAVIQLDPAGLDFDRDVTLIPVDVLGEPVPTVDVDPPSAHVRVAVFSDAQTRSVPVVPTIAGTPAPGFEIASVTVAPLVLPVEGDPDALVALSRLDTQPISLTGATETIDRVVSLALPAGVRAIGETDVHVVVTLRPVTGTRTFSAGIVLTGARSDRTYDISVDRVLVTLGGSIADLDRLEGQTFDVRAEVSGLEPGRHPVRVVVTLPAGLALVAASPDSVIVTVGLPDTSPPPSPVSP